MKLMCVSCGLFSDTGEIDCGESGELGLCKKSSRMKLFRPCPSWFLVKIVAFGGVVDNGEECE